MSNLFLSVVVLIISLCWLVCVILDIKKYDNLERLLGLKMIDTWVEIYQLQRELKELKDELTKE